MPLNWRLVADELEFILKDSGSTLCIYGEEFFELANDLQGRKDKTDIKRWLQVGGESPFSDDYDDFRDAGSKELPPIRATDDDMLYIMYTSGTTGLPKGVMHTHETTLWALFSFSASANDRRNDDRNLNALPLFHVGALLPVTMNIYLGHTSVIMREFDPQLAWQLIEEERINTSLLVPAMLNFMVQVPNAQDYDHSALRYIYSGASPLPVNLIKAYADIGIEVHQVYGLTESCGPGCLIDADNALNKIGSTGRGFFHTDVRIVDEQGNDCLPNEQGEVWLAGKHIMKGYWNRPDATAETITQDGWLRTGDVAVMDEDGFDYIDEEIGLDEMILESDIVITGQR